MWGQGLGRQHRRWCRARASIRRQPSSLDLKRMVHGNRRESHVERAMWQELWLLRRTRKPIVNPHRGRQGTGHSSCKSLPACWPNPAREKAVYAGCSPQGRACKAPGREKGRGGVGWGGDDPAHHLIKFLRYNNNSTPSCCDMSSLIKK